MSEIKPMKFRKVQTLPGTPEADTIYFLYVDASSFKMYVPNNSGTLTLLGVIDAGDVPSGGTTGQALVKSSGTDYDTGWADVVTPTGTQTLTNKIYDMPSFTGAQMGYTNASGAATFTFFHDFAHASTAYIAVFQAYGRDSAANTELYAAIDFLSNDNTSGSEDGRIDVRMPVAGTAQQAMSIAGGMTLGSPSGGNKGLGTLNAVSVYDDNALLSCYVIERFLKGSIDYGKWDNRVPDLEYPAVKVPVIDKKGNPIGEKEVTPAKTIKRRHEPMRMFDKRIGTKYDPLTLDGYWRHLVDKGHLTSMPNEEGFDPQNGLSSGEWIQRLIETVEIQAIHIHQLNERLKKMEKGE